MVLEMLKLSINQSLKMGVFCWAKIDFFCVYSSTVCKKKEVRSYKDDVILFQFYHLLFAYLLCATKINLKLCTLVL